MAFGSRILYFFWFATWVTENGPKPCINKRKHYKCYSKIDIHFNKQLIKTGCKAFCRPFGKDEAWFIKTGWGKKKSVFKSV